MDTINAYHQLAYLRQKSSFQAQQAPYVGVYNATCHSGQVTAYRQKPYGAVNGYGNGGYPYPAKNGVVYKNNVNYGTAYLPLVDSSIMSIVPPKTIRLPDYDSLPGMDSSIVSMVPPASVAKFFVAPTVDPNNNNILFSRRERNIHSRSEIPKFYPNNQKHGMPHIMITVKRPVKKSAPAEQKKVDIMHYVNNNYYLKTLVGDEDKVTVTETREQSRFLRGDYEYDDYHQVVESVLGKVIDGPEVKNVLGFPRNADYVRKEAEAQIEDIKNAEKAFNSYVAKPASSLPLIPDKKDAEETIYSDISEPDSPLPQEPERATIPDTKDAEETIYSDISEPDSPLPQEPERATIPDAKVAEESIYSDISEPDSPLPQEPETAPIPDTKVAEQSIYSDISEPDSPLPHQEPETAPIRDTKDAEKTSKPARQLPLCLRPFLKAPASTFQLCEFYRTSTIKTLMQHLTTRWSITASCDCCGETPVHFAVRRRSIELLSQLVRGQAKLNATNILGETALHIACKNDYVEMVACLLQCGADPLKETVKGETCLSVSQAHNNPRPAWRILLKIRDTLTQKFFDKRLLASVRDGSKEFVELYLKFDANIDHVDEEGNSALSLAVELGHEDILACLLDRQPDLTRNYKSETNTVLHLACQQNRDECVRQLLLAGASVHAMNGNFQTPLHVAAQYSSPNVIHMLLSFGAYIDAEDICLQTPLCYAVRHGKELAVKYLLSQGASTKSTGPSLIKAVYDKKYSVVRLLLNHGLLTDQRKHLKQTLCAIAKQGNLSDDFIQLWTDFNFGANDDTNRDL